MTAVRELSTCVDNDTIVYDDGTGIISATIPDPSDATPTMVSKTAGSPGTDESYARGDHQHEVVTGTPVDVVPGGLNAAGNSSSLARANHTHGLVPFGTTAGTIAEGNDSRFAPLGYGSVVGSTIGGGNVDGVQTTMSRSDHRHALAAFGTSAATIMQGNQAAGGDTTGTLDNLTVTQARGLKTTTGTVAVSAATAPVAGTALVATSSTTAAWTYPSGVRLPQTILSTGGGFQLISAVANSQIIVTNNSPVAYIINLPATHVAGDIIIIKRAINVTSSSVTITIDASGSQTIDGALTLPVSIAGFAVHLVSNGTNWLRNNNYTATQVNYPQIDVSSSSTVGAVVNTEYVVDAPGTTTINLPATHSMGDTIIVKLIKGSVSPAYGELTIQPSGVQVIDPAPGFGHTNLKMHDEGEVAWLVSNGSNWLRLNHPRTAAVLRYPQSTDTTATFNTLHKYSTTAGAVNVAIPTGHAEGDTIIVKMTSVATNTITIDPASSQTIDGALTLVLNTDYECVTLVSDGTNWMQTA